MIFTFPFSPVKCFVNLTIKANFGNSCLVMDIESIEEKTDIIYARWNIILVR